MRFIFRTSLCFLLVAGVVACEQKTVDIPQLMPDPGLSWQLRNDFLFDQKIQLTSYADSDRIILSGVRTTSVAPGDGRPGTDTSFVHYSGGAHPNGRTDYRPLLSSTFMAFQYTTHVNVILTANPVLSGANAPIRMSEIDRDFASFSTVPVNVGETMALNRRNQLLIPYTRYDRSYTTPIIDGNRLYLVLADLVAQGSGPYASDVAIKQTKIVQLEGGSNPASIHTIGDYFTVSMYRGKTYRIAPDGTIDQVYAYPMLRQFTYNGVLYGLTYSGGTSLQLLASTDQGSNWSVLTGQLPDDYARLNYKVVNNRLIASYYSQLLQIDITPTSLTITELDNTGLAGNSITSVAAFRNTVYVSTLSGVFAKPIRTFLNPLKK